jgi:hypothetical protein
MLLFIFDCRLRLSPLPAPLLMLIATTRWLCRRRHYDVAPLAAAPCRCRHAILPYTVAAAVTAMLSDAAAERALPPCQARAADACHAAFCCAAMPYCIIMMLRLLLLTDTVDAAAAIFMLPPRLPPR